MVTILGAEVPFKDYFDIQNKEKFLYLHQLVNYNFSPEWYYNYEKNYFSQNSIVYSFGSVETEDTSEGDVAVETSVEGEEEDAVTEDFSSVEFEDLEDTKSN